MQEGWFLSSAKVSPPTVTDKRVCMEGWARAQMCSGASGGRGPGTSPPVLEKPLPAGGLSLLGCRTSKEWPSSLLPSWARRAGGKVLTPLVGFLQRGPLGMVGLTEEATYMPGAAGRLWWVARIQGFGRKKKSTRTGRQCQGPTLWAPRWIPCPGWVHPVCWVPPGGLALAPALPPELAGVLRRVSA